MSPSITMQESRSIRFKAKIEQSLVACPIRAQHCAQLRSLTAIRGQPLPLHVRKPPSQSLTVLVFQAGHASSILVTRSTAKSLVMSIFLGRQGQR
jgi:hypothetical protein